MQLADIVFDIDTLIL